MTNSFWKEQVMRDSQPHRGLQAAEWAGLAYLLLTTCLIGLFYTDLNDPVLQLTERLAIVLGGVLLYGVYQHYPCRLTYLLRIALQFGLLAYWYPDTYQFNQVFPNLDHLFAGAEQAIFGCQPSIEFYYLMPYKWFSEVLHLGYWSYYPMIVLVMLYSYLFNPKHLPRVSFVIVASFFLHYTVYLLLPVVGPQYYFQAIHLMPDDLQRYAAEGFPMIGDYFRTHMELLPAHPETSGFFQELVENSQSVGERPTAAFPSSHIGLSTVLVCLAYKENKRLFAFLVPLYIALCLATVYIQAHYLIDAIAGLLTGLLSLWFTQFIFTKYFYKEKTC